MKVQRVFQKPLVGVFFLFGLIGVSTSFLCIYTVDTHLSEEYESNSRGIAKAIADSSVDIILNRDLSTLQSLIDQFMEIQGIGYIYITNEHGEHLAHTFVPGIPENIRQGEYSDTAALERHIPGLGDFIEVSSPILAGVAGRVHIGMNASLIALKVQRAVGQQVYLISLIFIFAILATIWLINLAAKPLAALMEYAARLARKEAPDAEDRDLLERDDEIGQLAHLFQYFSLVMDQRKAGRVQPTTRA